MQKILTPLIAISLILFNITLLAAQIPVGYSFDPHLLNWIKTNISPVTNLPYSFYIPKPAQAEVYQHMDTSGPVNGAIERTITQEGLDIYDGAVFQIVLSMIGGEENLQQAAVPLNYYWQGYLGELGSIRSGYPINLFVYDAKNPQAVSSDNNNLGQRGFIFRIINADGKYLLTDPLTSQKTISGFPEGGRVHWLDWKPVAGENAWVVIAAMQLYHKKYFDQAKGGYVKDPSSIELRLSQEIARAAILLQSQTGGIRMAPMGTHRDLTAPETGYFTEDNWWYKHISTENNISWYAAFRMLYEITGQEEYKTAMQGIERYLNFVWDSKHNMFYQGAYEVDGQWLPNREYFALDVQTWAIACLGPQVIDAWLGAGTSYRIWQTAKAHSGVFDNQGQVIGVGYSDEHDRVSVEWSAGAMLALQEVGEKYMGSNPIWSDEVFKDKISIRQHMETLHSKISDSQSAYSYSSRRGWIPFGWNSHDPQVMSLASSGWMMFVDAGVNPFRFIPKS
ncbi:MAG: hypothetical protein WCH62_01040 [Candidatus Omnitrophota bacterium]